MLSSAQGGTFLSGLVLGDWLGSETSEEDKQGALYGAATALGAGLLALALYLGYRGYKAVKK